MISTEKRIFVSVAAASGNIGDIYIRRAVLMILASVTQAEFRVFTGKMPDDYIEAVELPARSQSDSRSVSFAFSMLFNLVVRRDCVLLVSPGPAFLGVSQGARLKHLGLAAFAWACRLRGWSVLILGRSVVGGSRLDHRIERVLARSASIYTARDSRSAALLAPYASIFPDLAFAGASVSKDRHSRKRLIVSLRGDRPLPEWFVSQVSEFAESLNLVLTVVTQVRADGVRSGQLAEELKADLISWPTSVSAKDQESRLQAIYREAAVCLTDRLHVAALCIREGAFPIVYSSRSDSKLLDSLSPFFPFGYVDDGQGIVDVRLSSDRDDLLREAVSGAARKLDELSARLGVIVGGDC